MIKNVSDLLHREYGVRTTYRENPLVDEVGVAVTKIVGINPLRVGLTIVNLSGNVVYISPKNNVSAARGILLQPTGGFFSINWRNDMELCILDWYGISTAVNQDIYVLETTLLPEAGNGSE